MTIKEDLELLMQMQGIDYDLGELERSKEYIPDMMENLRKELEESERLYSNTSGELSEAKVSQSSLELEVSSLQENLKKLQGQMMAIKTNREYDALVAQMDTVKEAINTKESLLLDTIEKIEALSTNIEEYKKRAEEAKSLNSQQLDILQEKMDSVGTKIKIKQDERHNIEVRIPKRTMSIYERVRKSRGGSVVVPVRKRACGACFKGLPPHRVQELKRGDQIIICDNCGRLLVWQDGLSE